jgi:hypothetical protein
MSIPNVPQGGPLNRVRSSVTVQNTPTLNITSQFMGGGFVSVSFQGAAAELIGTGTGGVASLAPYKMATVTVDSRRCRLIRRSARSRSTPTPLRCSLFL